MRRGQSIATWLLGVASYMPKPIDDSRELTTRSSALLLISVNVCSTAQIRNTIQCSTFTSVCMYCSRLADECVSVVMTIEMCEILWRLGNFHSLLRFVLAFPITLIIIIYLFIYLCVNVNGTNCDFLRMIFLRSARNEQDSTWHTQAVGIY